MSIRALLIAIVLLSLSLGLISVSAQASTYGAAGMGEFSSLGCRDLATVNLSGFRPGTVLLVYALYEESDCDGNLRGGIYFQSVGATDINGELSYTFVHNGKGQYSYSFFDGYGGLAQVTMNTAPLAIEAGP